MMEQHTPGPWSGHPYSTPQWMDVGAGERHGAFKHASLGIGAGRKLIAKVEAQTPLDDYAYPQVESLEEMRANAALIAAAPDLLEQTRKDAARFAKIRDWLNGDRASDATARMCFAGEVWHMECEARAAIAKAPAV